MGSRWKVDVNEGTITNYSSNGLNQYTAVGGTGYSYDDNGNLTGYGVNSYTYDCENRLTGRAGGSEQVTCGDFSCSTGWVIDGTWSISGGVARFDGYDEEGGTLRQDVHFMIKLRHLM